MIGKILSEREAYIYLLSQMKYDWNTGSERIEEFLSKNCINKIPKEGTFSIAHGSHSVKLVHLVIFSRHEAASL